jgi:hypothetical protein
MSQEQTTCFSLAATPNSMKSVCPLDQRFFCKFQITQFSILMGYVFIPETVDGIYHRKQISLRDIGEAVAHNLKNTSDLPSCSTRIIQTPTQKSYRHQSVLVH